MARITAHNHNGATIYDWTAPVRDIEADALAFGSALSGFAIDGFGIAVRKGPNSWSILRDGDFALVTSAELQSAINA